jgi:hypothetical protein
MYRLLENSNQLYDITAPIVVFLVTRGGHEMAGIVLVFAGFVIYHIHDFSQLIISGH